MMVLKSNQKGVALFISLVLLLVLTIIGVSSVQTTSLEERMARNAHDGALAFQAAESALRQAEEFLETAAPVAASFTDTGSNGLWTVAPFGDTPRWANPSTWSGGSSIEVGAGIVGVSEQPRYIVEFVSSIERVQNPHDLSNQNVETYNIFRITALGVGGSDNARVLLQSSFGMDVTGT